MPYEHPARAARRRTTADLLARAIADIDRRLEQHRMANEPAPFSAYRARRILKKAQTGKLHDAGILIAACANEQAAQPDAVTKPQRDRRGPVERCEALPGSHEPQLGGLIFRACLTRRPTTNLRRREYGRGSHAYEGTTMAYDWTGETTRKRNRAKLATALLLTLAIVVGIPAVISPFI